MFSTLTNKKPPTYDLNSIFRPYASDAVGDPQPSRTSESSGRFATFARQELKSLFSLELSKFPKMSEDEPTMSWLLRAAGMVSDVVMRDVLDVSRRGGQSPYDLLRLSGRISVSDLRALDTAAHYVDSGTIYRDFAAIVLTYACNNFIEFDDALWDLGLHPNDPMSDFKLYELLDDCGVFPHADMLAVRRECLARGVTIGYSLVKNNMLSGQFLKVLLECLCAVGGGKLQYHDLVLTIISILRDTDTTYGTVDSSMTREARLVAQVPISTADRALGNLLLCTDLMELEDLIFCLEVALEDIRSLGSVVSDFMIVDVVVLQAARSLAYMVCEKKLTARRSVELLDEVRATGKPLAQMFTEVTSVSVLTTSHPNLSAVSFA